MYRQRGNQFVTKHKTKKDERAAQVNRIAKAILLREYQGRDWDFSTYEIDNDDDMIKSVQAKMIELAN